MPLTKTQTELLLDFEKKLNMFIDDELTRAAINAEEKNLLSNGIHSDYIEELWTKLESQRRSMHAISTNSRPVHLGQKTDKRKPDGLRDDDPTYHQTKQDLE